MTNLQAVSPCGSLRWSVLGCAGALMRNSWAKKIHRKYWNCMCCYMVKQNKKSALHYKSSSLLTDLKRGIQKKQKNNFLRSSKSPFDRRKACEVLLTSESLLWSAGGATPRTDRLGPWTAFAATSVLCVCVWTCPLAWVCGGYWSRLCSLPGASWSSAKARAL